MGSLLGVDIGTQGIKGVLLDEALNVTAQAYMEYDYIQPKQNWFEHDADKTWWGNFKQIVQRLLKHIDFSSEKIIGVGCSGLSPCFLPIDNNNHPLRNAILYGIDTRSEKEIDEITKILDIEKILNNNKQPLTTQSVGPKILWYKKNEPEQFSRTSRFFTTTNYIVYKLTGKYVLDDSQASFHAPFYNFNTNSWDREMCRLFEIPYDWFPPLKKSFEIAGTITAQAAAESGLTQGTPVIVGTADAIAEVFSTGAYEKGEVTLIYGTTGIIAITTDKCSVMKNLWILPHPITENEYLVVGGTAAAGALTKWYRNNFGAVEQVMQERININAYSLLLKQAEKIPAGSDGLVVLPYFSGERTPINDPSARGLIFGLTLSHNRAHIYKALLEGTAYSFQHHFDIFKQNNFPVSRVVACGGGTKSDFWPQIVSDVIGFDQSIPDTYLGAEMGSAYFAAIAVGMVEGVNAIKKFVGEKSCRLIRPDVKNHKIYQKYFDIYKRLYVNNIKEMHQLATYGESAR